MPAGMTFTVDITTDEDDGNTAAGDLSLREAVRLANTNDPLLDTITFAPALAGQTVNLSIAGDNAFGPSALAVSTAIKISGLLGDSGITIAWDGTEPVPAPGQPSGLRLFYVTSAGNLTFEDLTLSNGTARGGEGGGGSPSGAGGGGGMGGAIFNEGTLTIERSTLSGNQAHGGAGGNSGATFGGGPNGGGPNGGTGGPYGGNAGSGGFGGGGGAGGSAAFNGGNGGDGGIGGGGGGGGFHGFGGSHGLGGSPGWGGGAGGTASAAYQGGGGAGGGGGGLGGAIFNHSGTVTITNSTFSDNTAQGGRRGVSVAGSGSPGFPGVGHGGALFNLNGTVTFTNCTLADNRTLDGDGVIFFKDGGAAYNLAHAVGRGVTAATPATLNLKNAILADSKASFDLVNHGMVGSAAATVNATAPDINIVESGIHSAGGATVIKGSVLTVDPNLAPLSSNGGPTRTHALQTAPTFSPAIDTGTNTGAPTVDQRGFDRPQDGDGDTIAETDIGAYELLPPTDFGDAPDTVGTGPGNYTTLASVNGPRHKIVAGLSIGTNIDADSGTLQNAAATADDLNGSSDDEDGISNPATQLAVTIGTTPSVDVHVFNQTGSDARLVGWIDYNGDGVFDAVESADTIVPDGSNGVVMLTFPGVPFGSFVGTTYARFRLSTDAAAALSPTGFAPDGEVEDYQAEIISPYDFGDLPDTAAGTGSGNYHTTYFDVGPQHTIDPDIRMGDNIDGDNGALQNAAADADDLDGSPDDEDGLVNPAVDLALTIGSTPTINVHVTNKTGTDAFLVGWIDYNANGNFENSTEQAFISVPDGTDDSNVTLVFFQPVPPGYTGATYARFRLSTDVVGVSHQAGAATDGEVEDYQVQILPVDFGDAPDTAAGTGTGNYNTLASDNGPFHTIDADIRMGDNIDGDDGTLQNAAANADDLDGSPDDEDGLVSPAVDLALAVGTAPTVNVHVTNKTGMGATLYGWIDYNANGVFDNATERASIAVPDGEDDVNVTLVFPVVPSGHVGTTYARFRISTDSAAANPTGAAADGEVEDYPAQISAPPLDFGDAPDTALGTGIGNYNTLASDNGPSHFNTGPTLGALRDTESDGQPNATATGDDVAAFDDEDGVVLPATLTPRLSAKAMVTASAASKLDAWIDFNRDGDFNDPGEQIAKSLPLVAGVNNVAFDVPESASAGTSFARFRLSTAGGLAPTGAAADGEVEDYQTQIDSLGTNTARLVDDPKNPGQKALLVVGSSSSDEIEIEGLYSGSIFVEIENGGRRRFSGTFPGNLSRIIVYGLAGNDQISVASNVPIPTWLYGDDGDDQLKGGARADVMLGGRGNDKLEGRDGRDLLIGGLGKDFLFGGRHDDLLIAGFTDHDASELALCQIMKEWERTDILNGTYQKRVDHLMGTLAGGLNGPYLLNDKTVHDEGLVDELTGNSELDWFLANLDGDGSSSKKDRLKDALSSERKTDIDQ